MTSEYQVCDHLTSVRYCQRFQLDSVDLGGGWLQVPAENGQLQPYFTTQIQDKVSSLPSRYLSCFYTSYNLLEKLSKDIAAVNALLAYSRGQLALAPCTECNDNYEWCGSAMPFPDCVFLPTYWGFACASCIARHRAVECSFNIIRAEYREQCWEMIQIPVYGVASPVSKWLERGHPLLASDPQTLYTLWKRRDSGNDPTHDLTQPIQEPSFIWPPDIPNARLPDCSQQLSAPSPSDLRERLSLLREQFRTKRNIVVITGAGISTNTGSKS